MVQGSETEGQRMLMDRPVWKENWKQTQEHFLAWWQRKGPILVLNGLPDLEVPRDGGPPPVRPDNPRKAHTDPEYFAQAQKARLARLSYPADNLPIAHTDYGCVQLAACLGSEPEFDFETVWYNDSMPEPDAARPLVLTKDEPWWWAYLDIMRAVLEKSRGDFLVGMPAFGSNLDVLAELRGTENLLFDLTDRSGWVLEKLEEINQAFFTAFDEYYEHIRLSDGSSAYTYFSLWGPGKVSQVQCDFAAMISPAMFKEFVVPALTRQCTWLDHSLFHLDGPSCICHLDHLLGIEELDAVQWTPGAGEPGAGDPKWYDLYRRVLDAGKSVQILGTAPDEAKRIADRFGTAGVYISVEAPGEGVAENLIEVFS